MVVVALVAVIVVWGGWEVVEIVVVLEKLIVIDNKI